MGPLLARASRSCPLIKIKHHCSGSGVCYFIIKNHYIYQHKDHLGNARISFARNSAGALEITDANDYYPFGMNQLKTGNAFFGSGTYKNYKYNGKELQESGMYDYGARFYMPDLGRWGVVDPLTEKMTRHSPYNYAFNNPLRFIDPDGRKPEDDFRLLKTGKLELIRKTDSDETKGVHTIYNEDNSKSVTVNKDVIDNRLDGKSKVREGDDSRITDSSVYISTDEKSMKSFFNFIKDNVTNEFSLAGYKNVKEGGKEVFAISTEYKKSQEGVGGYMAWKILNNKSMKMTEFTHLHPGGTLVPSGFNGHGSPTEGDRGNKILFENDFYKNRTPDNFNIVVPNSKKTIIYDSSKFEVK
ncbi:RHS repeat domain-containing protein [Chryseobacterium culicis]|uniref:RHS repeat domain-containing protein n=1 Tax=Chryseobacterium culicis TaxID=680127 RepID=UPI0018771527|nr:RHS repeat-associated core domain-containing protein [Chryseobacterium culicis]MBE4949566.1 RHS repeat-associated core domain-containing protein [Chryseobacterium culicis]